MKIINIKNRKETIRELEKMKYKIYLYNEIQIQNLHLKKLNNLAKANLFSKNSLFVAPSTLWAAMQKSGSNNSHNFHNMTPEDVYDAISSITNPKAIYVSLRISNRFIIVTTTLFKKKTNIIIVIEKDASASWNRKAFINKLVTIYPKDKISTQNNELFYKK